MITKIDARKIKHNQMLGHLFEIAIISQKANRNKTISKSIKKKSKKDSIERRKKLEGRV